MAKELALKSTFQKEGLRSGENINKKFESLNYVSQKLKMF